jgi:hypothetical protein
MPRSRSLFALSSCAAIAVVVLACGGADSDPPPGGGAADGTDSPARGVEPAGQSCTTPAQCYADVERGADGGAAVSGEVTCLAKVTNGYCTHTCAQDSECCRAPGECRTGVAQVCAPLSDQPAQYCFPSCEDEDIARALAANADAGFYDGGATDAGGVADAYCQSFAGATTKCRSTGGGNKNRKVCIPKE